MKKLSLLTLLVIGSLLLTGCSLESMRQQIEGLFGDLVKQDQQHEQWFVVTKKQVYEYYYPTQRTIQMQNMGLTQIPDFCRLVDQSDHANVYHIDLASNDIRVVDQDLSCFTFLQTLDLSFNQVDAVVTLGQLPMLRELSFEKNQLSSTSNLPAFPSLEKLSLGYNNLREVTNIDQYQNLLELELQHNQIEQIVGAENLQKLEKIKLEFNNLQQADFIEELTNLERATLRGNQIQQDLVERRSEITRRYIQGENDSDTSTGTATWTNQ